MIKQRNIFSDAIDILKDEKTEPEQNNGKQIIEAFNQGLKIKTKQAKGPRTEAPLFGEYNYKQSNLF